MTPIRVLAAALLVCALVPASAREAKLVRYPHYHQGRVVFSYLGDIWAADENGQNVQRLTAHAARDTYPRFSPDGRWVAFSSDRNGNLDVFIVPSGGGAAKQLTYHSADDSTLGWTPDSRAVLFSSSRGEDFMPKLYLAPIDGGMPRSAGPDMGIAGSYSPDGRKLALNRKGQVYWRKYYRGAYQTDITVMDIAAKKFTDLTDFDGLDSWPMWSRDGYIYFVSDREGGGLTNIWRVPEKGGKAERVTSFKTGDVRFPAISADGKAIVFEHDFGVWKLDVASRKAAALKFDIAAETQDNLATVRSFTSQADEYHLAPSGRRFAFSIYGEIFTAPVEEGDLRQITSGPARDRAPVYSPDGKQIAFVSDRSGREEIWAGPADGSAEPRKLTDLDVLKSSLAWSPDSKELVFVCSDNTLRKHSLDGKQTSELTSSKYGPILGAVWSPDGRWVAYSKPDRSRTNDIYLAPSAGGQERKVTFESYSEFAPRFTPDGRKLYFLRREDASFGSSSTQIYSVALERQERDPDDPEERPEPPEPRPERPERPAASQPVKEIQIDWAGLKRRTRQVTRMPHEVSTYAIAPDNRTIVFAVEEPAGTRSAPVIYSIQEDGKRLTRVTASAPSAGEEESPAPPRFGFFGQGAVHSFHFSRDGRTLYFQEGKSLFSVPMPAAGPGAGPAAAGARGAEGSRRRLQFTAKVRIDKPAEWAQMFDDAWRTMKYRFYDPKMHGYDWDAMRAKYQPLVEHVGDRQELLNVVNEMIGELNASHTGAAPPPGPRGEGAVSTVHLGMELEPDESARRYRVTHVYESGPADKDWVKVKTGDYLIAIDGQPVMAGDNYWKLLNNQRLNRRVTVSLNDKPSEEGAWKARIEPATTAAYSQLRYERWTRQRREMVDKLSGGRVGYLHIQAMNPPSLRKFEKEIREFRDKEALVIDQRWNGGGNIEQQLLAILVQRQYQVWQPRGTEQSGRPFAGFFGPKVVLQNWRSASNAEMFPAGFKALGLGKTVGTPTVGAVIGTGSYSLIDGSTVRTPGVGVFLADSERTNMENYGVRPDILVENTAEDNLAGRDRQVEVAVQELLKELGGRGAVTGN
ncbi:MAG: PD40 domain-containing protein [Candidatus Solibacter usitatus]|nr:PD40 domain-containing protein [Candidatus Solibacter usitatus]